LPITDLNRIFNIGRVRSNRCRLSIGINFVSIPIEIAMEYCSYFTDYRSTRFRPNAVIDEIEELPYIISAH